MVPTVSALADRGTLDLLAHTPDGVTFEHIATHTRANRGYLRVALRLMASCGWLLQRIEDGRVTAYTLTDAGRAALAVAPRAYADVVSFVPKAIAFEEHLSGQADDALVRPYSELVERARSRWSVEEPAGAPREVCEMIRG